MRTFKLEIIEYEPLQVRVEAAYGNEKDATATPTENMVADRLRIGVQVLLHSFMSAAMTGAGGGNTIEEARQRCEIETAITRASEEGGESDGEKA
jgi:hypothetical protein